ncbi:non-canonical purine NTP pyrophosphatase [Candidatus Woesearchaeota archaeon]|nr:non-canonical purine NTP pyrophosphatase [Candidatus Woesearchaeota archaeon]
MKLYFLTGNRHKFEQVRNAMEKLGVEIEQIKVDKPEIQADTLEEVSRYAAEKVAAEQGKAVVVEDTGIFFEAFRNFPGVYAKFISHSLGYEGILKLLQGRKRGAYFKTVAAYAEPGKPAVLFSAETHGRISEEVYCQDADVMYYDRIFIPDGWNEPWCKKIAHEDYANHRKAAFVKLAEYLKKDKHK